MRGSLIVVMMIVAGTLGAQAQDKSAFRLQDLDWLTGYWVLEREETRTEECWLEPLGDVMVGVQRELRANGDVFYEYLRIEARADGIYYVAKPSNQPEAAFPLVALEPGLRAIFENKAHDFPQTIMYEREPDGGLRATIEGLVDQRAERGRTTTSVWLMRPASMGNAP